MLKFAASLLAAVCVIAPVLSASEAVKCPDTRDVWLSGANKDESDTNGGKAEKIKLKVLQEFGLLDFDVSALKGKEIEKASLFVAPDGGGMIDKKRGTDLRWFTVSTIGSDWVEGDGTQYSKDDAGKGATFNEASYKTRPWAYPGSHCYDVILGNGKSLRCDVDAGDPKNGWFEIPLDKRLVEALVAKASYGLLLMDGSTGSDRNCYIASRESGKKAPYLRVTLKRADTQAPAAPAGLAVKPSPNDADAEHGAALLSFDVPEGAFSYNVKINGEALPRWQTPFAAAAGTKQDVLLEYLPPDADLNIEIAAVDAAGNASAPASIKGRSSPRITVPALPVGDFKPIGGEPKTEGKLKVWAFPEISKIDPLTGAIQLEPGMEAAAQKNSVWDGASNTVRVAAARGEIAGFQLALQALKGPVANIKVNVVGLDGVQVRMWRTWFVEAYFYAGKAVSKRWQPEYAIPFAPGAATALPTADTKVPEQKATSLAIDLIVPENVQPGERNGTIVLSADGMPEIKLNLKLKIYSATIPKEIHFNPELNCYGGPGKAGSARWFDSFRLAHYHRATINRVPYSHSGNTHEDYIPAVGADGKVTDWSNFDKNLGPLLDGSAFKDNPRAGVPVPTLYLPQYESWPMPFLANYHPGGTYTGKDWKALHDISAKPPETAFSKAYQDGFTANIADFARHFDEKGWSKTLFEVFLNNKYFKTHLNKEKLGGNVWVLDEPAEYLDWHALNFFSRLAHAGFKQAKTAQFAFRGDISRPEWQGNYSDGLMEIMYVNGAMYKYVPLLRDDKRRMPTVLYNYGSCNAMNRSNHESTAWCLKAYVHECDGVLPWQCIGKDAAFDVGDGDRRVNGDKGEMLIVDGSKRFGVNAIASYRVHALRSGAQLCELLRLLEIKRGWGRRQSNALVSELLPLGTEFKQGFADEAAALQFNGLNGDLFVKLKEGLLLLLEK